MIGIDGRSGGVGAHLDGEQAKKCRGTYLEVLSDFTDKTLEGEFADEELSGFLVASDLAESDSTGPETMRLLDSSGGVLNSNR